MKKINSRLIFNKLKSLYGLSSDIELAKFLAQLSPLKNFSINYEGYLNPTRFSTG